MRQLVPKECTFTPNLSKTLPSRPSTSLPSPSFRLDTELSVHERLYKIAEIHRERLEMRRANSTQHLFSPAITPKAADLKAAEEAARLAGKPVDPPGERLYNLVSICILFFLHSFFWTHLFAFPYRVKRFARESKRNARSLLRKVAHSSPRLLPKPRHLYAKDLRPIDFTILSGYATAIVPKITIPSSPVLHL